MCFGHFILSLHKRACFFRGQNKKERGTHFVSCSCIMPQKNPPSVVGVACDTHIIPKASSCDNPVYQTTRTLICCHEASPPLLKKRSLFLLCPLAHFYWPILLYFFYSFRVYLRIKVGKWAENPQTLINQRFPAAHFCFESGQKPTFSGQFCIFAPPFNPIDQRFQKQKWAE